MFLFFSLSQFSFCHIIADGQFKRRLKSVAVDGEAIMAAAKSLGHKSLTRLEAKDLAAKEAAKKEEERVAGLKKVRGEKWLPSIARQKMYQF